MARFSARFGPPPVVDLSKSHACEAGHVPGAWHSTRAKLPDAPPRIPAASLFVPASEDGTLARSAVPEAEAAIDAPVPTGRARGARPGLGYPPTGDFGNMAGKPDDRCPPAWGRDADAEQVMRGSPARETCLVEQAKRGGDAWFGRPGRTCTTSAAAFSSPAAAFGRHRLRGAANG